MKNMSFVLVLFLCILHLSGAKKVNVAVTLHRQDIFALFSEDEIWAMHYQNKTSTSDIVQLNVVIDDMVIAKLNKDIVITYDIIYADVAAVIERERHRLNNRTKWTSSMRPDVFFQEYRNWPEYLLFIDYLLWQFPSLTTQTYLGQTIQGRDIPLLTVSSGPSSLPKRALYIQAALHAREWLANSATMYILNALLEGYGTDPEITDILNTIDIYIVPTVNIDGYIYTWQTERMWRKNRRNNGDGSFGVDLNRNYDGPEGTWCTVGASTNPSSDTYCGTGPYSEPEVAASARFVLNGTHNIGASVDMHTSGPLILYPWGWTPGHVPDPYYDIYVALSGAVSAAIYDVHGVEYVPTQTLYPTSGTMRDFPFAESEDEYKIYSFTWEGRGPGFNPPASNIIPAGQEELAGMLTVARFLIDRE